MVVSRVTCYCETTDHKPTFTGPPLVDQSGNNRALVTWTGLVTSAHCADDFVVKMWPSGQSRDSRLSDSIRSDIFQYEVTGVTSGTDWVIQVIARENKGIIGMDWNKSPTTLFRISTFSLSVTSTELVTWPEDTTAQTTVVTPQLPTDTPEDDTTESSTTDETYSDTGQTTDSSTEAYTMTYGQPTESEQNDQPQLGICLFVCALVWNC